MKSKDKELVVVPGVQQPKQPKQTSEDKNFDEAIDRMLRPIPNPKKKK